MELTIKIDSDFVFLQPETGGWSTSFHITHFNNPDKLSAKAFYEQRRQEHLKAAEGKDWPPFDNPTKAKETTINGIKAFQFVTFAFDGNVLHTYFSNEDILIDVSYYSDNPNDPDQEEHLKLFDQILSTFKFTK